MLNGVLRRQDEEWFGHEMGDTVGGDLALFHHLKERRLRLGGGPVDLIGQHDLCDDRPFTELEIAGLLVVDRNSSDVTGQQVWRELDALEGAPHGLGKAFGEHGLASTRHVLDQRMAAAKEGYQRKLHLSPLANDNSLHVVHNRVRDRLAIDQAPPPSRVL